MKRYLQLALGGLVVVAMASPLYAAPDIKVTGQVRARYRYWVDFDLDNNSKFGSSGSGSATGSGGGDRRYFDNRTRFGVDAKLGEGVRARIELEKYFDFGNTTPNGFTPSSGGGVGGSCCLATPNDSENSPYFRQAWMDFQIPGLPEGWRMNAGRGFFSVGHQYLWGNSLTGEDGFTLYGPLGPGTFKGRYAVTFNRSATDGFKNGRQRWFDNEVNNWAVDYKFDVAEGHTAELYFLGQNDRAVNHYSPYVNTEGRVNSGDDYYVGGAYSGVVGPVTLKFEGAYQFGTTRKQVAFSADSTSSNFGLPCSNPARTGLADANTDCSSVVVRDIDRSAGFVAAEASYKVVPQFTTALNVSYATGDSDASDDTYNNFVSPLAGFTTAISRVYGESPFFYGNRTLRAIGNNTTNRLFGFWGRGSLDIDTRGTFPGGALDNDEHLFSPGLIEVKWKNQYAVSDQFTLFADFIYLWSDKEKSDLSIDQGESKNMGPEIDLKAAYKPYKNVITNFYFGWFFPQDFFDRPSAISGSRSATDTAWAFRWEVVTTF